MQKISFTGNIKGDSPPDSGHTVTNPGKLIRDHHRKLNRGERFLSIL